MNGDNCKFVIVNDEVVESSDTSILNANERYNKSDICEYVLPVSEMKCPKYEVVSHSDKFHNVNYD